MTALSEPSSEVDFGIRKEILSPHLPKPGLRVEVRKDDLSLLDLVRARIIRREELIRNGFILVDGLKSEDRKNTESIVSQTEPLFLHSDCQITVPAVENVLMIRYPHQDLPRLAYTGIGDRTHLFEGLLAYIANTKVSPLPAAFRTIRAGVKGREGVIDPQTFRKSPDLLWKDWIFHEEASFITEGNFPELIGFLTEMHSYIYWHEWSPGQTLLIDDLEMAHARIPFKRRGEHSGYLLQSLWKWDQDGPLTPSEIKLG